MRARASLVKSPASTKEQNDKKMRRKDRSWHGGFGICATSRPGRVGLCQGREAAAASARARGVLRLMPVAICSAGLRLRERRATTNLVI